MGLKRYSVELFNSITDNSFGIGRRQGKGLCSYGHPNQDWITSAMALKEIELCAPNDVTNWIVVDGGMRAEPKTNGDELVAFAIGKAVDMLSNEFAPSLAEARGIMNGTKELIKKPLAIFVDPKQTIMTIRVDVIADAIQFQFIFPYTIKETESDGE